MFWLRNKKILLVLKHPYLVACLIISSLGLWLISLQIVLFLTFSLYYLWLCLYVFGLSIRYVVALMYMYNNFIFHCEACNM